MKLCDIFDIKYPKTLVYANMIPQTDGINFVSSKGTNNGIVGRVQKQDNITIYPAGSITVPLKGTVLMAHIQPEEFYIAHQTAVLIAKNPLTIQEKIYYILCIRKNAFKYNYGRQADRTLVTMEVPAPENIPSWVYDIDMPSYDDISEAKNNEIIELPPVSEWKKFTYGELFDMKRGYGISAKDAKDNPGPIPYLGASEFNNGVTMYSKHDPLFQGNAISVSSDGSVGEAFYQPNPFNATTNITVLTLKDNTVITPAIGMFLTTLIKQEKFKFSYGRKWGITRMKDSIIKLPITKDEIPDWDLIERYINSLPYSKYL